MRAAGEGGTRKGSRNGRREARSIAIFIFCVVLIFAQTSNLMVFASTPTTTTSHDDEWTGRIMRSSPQRKARFLGKVSFYAPSSSPSHHVHRLPAINGDPGKLYGDDKRIVHTGFTMSLHGCFCCRCCCSSCVFQKNESMALAFSSRV